MAVLTVGAPVPGLLPAGPSNCFDRCDADMDDDSGMFDYRFVLKWKSAFVMQMEEANEPETAKALTLAKQGKFSNFSIHALKLKVLASQTSSKRLQSGHSAQGSVIQTYFSTSSHRVRCSAVLNARCSAEQQTIQHQSAVISKAPIQGKEKAPELDDGGIGGGPGRDDGGGGGGGGGGGWAGGFFFFGFLAFLGFLKDKEREGPYREENSRRKKNRQMQLY
eukprot:Gb_19404 [translate_table: standard]